MANVFHTRGSLLFGILGSIVSVVLTIGLAEPLKLNNTPNILFGVLFLSVPLLGMAGFYFRQRQKDMELLKKFEIIRPRVGRLDRRLPVLHKKDSAMDSHQRTLY